MFLYPFILVSEYIYIYILYNFISKTVHAMFYVDSVILNDFNQII